MDANYCRVCLGHKGTGCGLNEYIAKTDTLFTALCRVCPTAFKDEDKKRWSAVVCRPCKRRIIVSQDLYELCTRSTEKLEQLDLQDAKKKKTEDTVPPVQDKSTPADQDDEFDAVFFASSEDAGTSLPIEQPADSLMNDQKKDAPAEQDDEFDADFFGTPQDPAGEVQPDLVDHSMENAAAKACLGAVEIGDETIALVNLEYLLSAAKENPTASGTMASSSIINDNLNPFSVNETNIRNTFSANVNVPSPAVDGNTEAADSADVEMNFPGCAESSSEESEEEIDKIFKKQTYYCWDRCGMYFFDKPSFDKHLKDHKMRRRWFCKFCFIGFDSQNDMCEHLSSHDGSLLCQICGKLANTPEENCHDHSKDDRHSKNVEPFDCPKCPRRLGTRVQLQAHLKTHAAKEFCCDQCGLYLSSSRRLRDHITSKHSGEKPFSCEVCGHKFTLKEHIKNHMRTHTDAKPFGCMFCERRYRCSTDLKDHLRKHLGDKIYQCDQCDTTFRLIKELKEHYEQTHYGEGAGASTTERRPGFRFTLDYLVNLRRQKELDKLYVAENNSPDPES